MITATQFQSLKQEHKDIERKLVRLQARRDQLQRLFDAADEVMGIQQPEHQKIKFKAWEDRSDLKRLILSHPEGTVVTVREITDRYFGAFGGREGSLVSATFGRLASAGLVERVYRGNWRILKAAPEAPPRAEEEPPVNPTLPVAQQASIGHDTRVTQLPSPSRQPALNADSGTVRQLFGNAGPKGLNG